MAVRPQDYMSAAECKKQAIEDYLTWPIREVKAELRQMESTLNAWHPWAVEAAREAVKHMERWL